MLLMMPSGSWERGGARLARANERQGPDPNIRTRRGALSISLARTRDEGESKGERERQTDAAV